MAQAFYDGISAAAALIFLLAADKLARALRPRLGSWKLAIGLACFLLGTCFAILGSFGNDGAQFDYNLSQAIGVALLGWLIGWVIDARMKRETPATESSSPAGANSRVGQNEGVVRPSEMANDPYKVAGEELLRGNMKPGVWARALVAADGDESSQNAEYVRLRVAELEAKQIASREALEEKAAQERAISPTFGYSAHDPILCRTEAEEIEYTGRLRGAVDDLVQIWRCGSVTSTRFENPVNRWNLELANGDMRTIYVYPYDATRSEQPPRGLMLADID